MKKAVGVALGFVVAALAVGGVGYWVGQDQTGAAVNTSASADATAKDRKILHYRNPMGLPDTSPVPKKDPMGMDYIPVYENEQDEEPASVNQIRIGTEKVQKIGVRTEVASLRSLDRVVRAAARIEPDERRTYAISPKFEGYVERLHVNTTGQPVVKGQPLFEVYSPELVSAQREYIIAAQGVGALSQGSTEAQSSMRQLADSSLLRIKNWDISDEQIKALRKSGQARRTLTFRSPVNGIITDKKIIQGMRFMPGDALYQVADLSAVWAVADVFEQDIGLLKTGAKAKVSINAYPGKVFEGTISYVYPTLQVETRTVPIRIELANPDMLLKAGMYAQVELPVATKGQTLTVPDSAVIDSGIRQIVLVQIKEGRYEPREVKLGGRSENYVEVLEGVREGESVVVAANFLIDAESNLKAAVGSFGHVGHGGSVSSDAASATIGVSTGYEAEGNLEEIDAKSGTVSISHGPIAKLKWPAMTMEFKLANSALLKGLKLGSPVIFEFIERAQGEWVVTSIKASAAVNASHAGH